MAAMTPDANDDAARIGPVRHASAQVWCVENERPAVVSVIDRNDDGRAVRFVLWCSLRACDQCNERCLSSLGCRPCLSPAGAADIPAAVPAVPHR